MFATRGLQQAAFSRTAVRKMISDKYIPRKFPVKATTGIAGLSVEPLWKPKLFAATVELKAYLKQSDIPTTNTYYNTTMFLITRVLKGIEECEDDWVTIERKYFWGWPVEMMMQFVWRELETAQKYNEARLWELDPDAVRTLGKETVGLGKEGDGWQPPWEQVARRDYDRRKRALSQEEMNELKKMDTERMARESQRYKQRKEMIRDDMERARGDLLKKFLNKRFSIDAELKKMQPGSLYGGKYSKDVLQELKEGYDAAAAERSASVKDKLP
jgi:hypothetical protein